MKRVVIAPGDGIGPEVIPSALEILRYYHPEMGVYTSISWI
jgi:Isocitrate/isopropylmalate dehydrogenase